MKLGRSSTDKFFSLNSQSVHIGFLAFTIPMPQLALFSYLILMTVIPKNVIVK